MRIRRYILEPFDYVSFKHSLMARMARAKAISRPMLNECKAWSRSGAKAWRHSCALEEFMSGEAHPRERSTVAARESFSEISGTSKEGAGWERERVCRLRGERRPGVWYSG